MLGEKPAKDLLGLYNDVLRELLRRKIIRSTNNPVADLAEFLAQHALQLELVQKSTKGYDATDWRGRRYEIKGRRLTQENSSRQLSTIRELDKSHFTHLIAILFTEDFGILRACVIPIELVREWARPDKHVNGWRFELKDAVLQHEGVQDITSQVAAVLNNI